MADEKKTATVAYVPFRTLINALDSLSHGVPHMIDRSIFPQMSGVTQSQLMGAMRFLKLVSPDGKPEPCLHGLAMEKDKRAENLKRVLEQAYPELIQSDLSKATPTTLNSAFEKYGLTGETNVKAKSFFLQAAKAAGIPLSPYLLKVTRTVSKKRRISNSNREVPFSGPPPDYDDYALDRSQYFDKPGLKKVIHLDNYAVLSLTVDRNFGELPSKQRRFVNELIDAIEEFDRKSMEEDEAAWQARQPQISS